MNTGIQGTTEGNTLQNLPNGFLFFLHKYRHDPKNQSKTFYLPDTEGSKICLEVPLNVLNGFLFLMKYECVISEKQQTYQDRK